MKKKPTLHRSVSALVRDLSEDRAFAEEFDKRLSGRQLIKALTVLRTRAELSQQDLAKKLECTQSKVSKLESSDDADICFGDLLDYTGAIGYEMRIFLMPRRQHSAEQVKMHAFVIKRLLDRIGQLAGKDALLSEESSLPLQVEVLQVDDEEPAGSTIAEETTETSSLR
jgi:transcriptional regulator with XRE-family HTH domain